MKKEFKLLLLGVVLLIGYFIAYQFNFENKGFLGGFFSSIISIGGVLSILDSIQLFYKRKHKKV